MSRLAVLLLEADLTFNLVNAVEEKDWMQKLVY